MSDLGLLSAARHLEVFAEAGHRLAALPPDTLDLSVPTVEGWTVQDVVRHTGKVHRRVSAFLAAPPGADPGAVARGVASLSEGPSCLTEYAAAHDALLGTLADLDLDAPVPTFAGPRPGAFWVRRQAQEVSVHVVDATDALAAAGGPPGPLPAVDVAVDGVDEWLRLFLATLWVRREGLPADLHGRTVHLHGTDPDLAGASGSPLDAEWTVAVGDGPVTVAAGHAKGDVALRGPAAHLLLTLWRRRPLDLLDVVGDRAVAERLLDVVRI
jgi:uncharacterized protein (TIGR03083 family)